jgi:quercetin dioxygenase-like cupin family protein
MSTVEQQTRDFWFADTLGRILVAGDETDGRACVVEVTGHRGAMPPLHVHHVDDEIFHLLEGELTLHHGARSVTLTAGETALARRGVPHTFRIESDVARVLVTGTPAGFDRFIEAFGTPAERLEVPAAPVPPDIESVIELERETGYRVEILGPPGALPA